MGLDQYIYHVTKTHYDEQHTFNRNVHKLLPMPQYYLKR